MRTMNLISISRLVKSFSALFHWAILASILVAGGVTLRSGGISPAGRFEIKRSYEIENRPSSFRLRLIEKESGKDLGPVPDEGIPFTDKQEKWEDFLMWHPKREAFALLDSVSRRENRLRFFSVEEGKIVEVDLPDHIMNVLGRIGSLATGMVNITRFLGWQRDDLKVTCLIQPAEDHSKNYSSLIAIRIAYDESEMKWHAALSSVSHPVEQ